MQCLNGISEFHRDRMNVKSPILVYLIGRTSYIMCLSSITERLINIFKREKKGG